MSKVPCMYCDAPTHMIHTKQCDNCHEVSRRVSRMGTATLSKILRAQLSAERAGELLASLAGRAP